MIKDILILTIFPGAMALAAASDFFTMTIPNRLVLALASGFFVMAPLVGLGWSDIELHMGLGLAALAFAFALFSFGWIGGGDAKLFAGRTAVWRRDPYAAAALLADYAASFNAAPATLADAAA